VVMVSLTLMGVPGTESHPVCWLSISETGMV
jgi:hypothetical protein